MLYCSVQSRCRNLTWSKIAMVADWQAIVARWPDFQIATAVVMDIKVDRWQFMESNAGNIGDY